MQVPDEPLELSIVSHFHGVSSMLLKGAPEEKASIQKGSAWLRDAMVNHLKRA
jgi:hypothetical protein